MHAGITDAIDAFNFKDGTGDGATWFFMTRPPGTVARGSRAGTRLRSMGARGVGKRRQGPLCQLPINQPLAHPPAV